jgi:hypothetical protein
MLQTKTQQNASVADRYIGSVPTLVVLDEDLAQSTAGEPRERHGVAEASDLNVEGLAGPAVRQSRP